MSNELIHELVDALEYSSDFIPMWALKCDDVVETLAKARAYLASGGWTRVEDGLPVVPDGLDHVEIFFFCEQDCERRVGRRLWLDVDATVAHGITHWRYVEPTPEPPRKDRTMTANQKLPDGSAFFTASLPLPKDHWIFQPRCQDWDDARDDYADKPQPILSHEQRDHVIAAIRYAIRGATNCGADMDFDPDALVQNAVVALCGPYPVTAICK